MDALVQEKLYRIIAEHTQDIIVLVDHEANVRYVSPSIYSLGGYAIEEYKDAHAFEILHPEDRERVNQVFVEVLKTKQPADVEYRVVHKEGHTLYAEARVKPVPDSNGQVEYVVAVVRDVTERHKTGQLLEQILDNINAVVFSTDQNFSRYSLSVGSIEKLSGLRREELMNSPIRLHDHIHPDDNAVLFGETKEKLDRGMRVVQDFRFIHVPDETRWGRLIMQPYVTHTGVMERLDGIIMDITEKKRSDLALEESEQRYTSLFENNLDGVFTMELNGFYFVHANRAFETITGIPMSQLAGRCFIGMVHDEDHTVVYEKLFEVLRQGKPGDCECRLNSVQPGEKFVSLTLVPIFLAGQLNGIHGIVKDITVRKREERELIESEERYKSLQQSLNRFSSDLANVMKVSELERRLLEEVTAVLKVEDAAIEEAPSGQEVQPGDPHKIRVRIGEKQQPVYLSIALSQPLLKIEKEWLETAIHYVTLLYDNLQRIEDLMTRLESHVAANETPKWMLRLLFQLSEKERASLSSDLHDSVLQDLIIWYRKLESLRSSEPLGEPIERQLRQIEEGLLDAIHQIRITCNELRPPFLLKMGLVESLKSLFAYTRMFSNYEIEFTAEPQNIPLNEDQLLGMYRIVQELLHNAAKHSQASQVKIALSGTDEQLFFTYADDGVGMDMSAYEGSIQHMGLAGIEKRVLSLEGRVELQSALNAGFCVRIRFPIQSSERGRWTP